MISLNIIKLVGKDIIKLVGEDIQAKASVLRKAHDAEGRVDKANRKFGITGGNHGFQWIWPQAVPETRCCPGWCRRRRRCGRRMDRERPVSQVWSFSQI